MSLARYFAASFMVAAFSFIASCGPLGTVDDQSAALTPDAAERLGRGEAIATTLCAACHAVGADGLSPHVDAVPFRRFSWRYPLDQLRDPLAEGIDVAHPDMPNWQFAPEDIDALLAYIESIQEPQET